MVNVLKDIGFTSEGFELYIPRRNRMIQEMEYFRGIAAKAVHYAETERQEYVWFASAVASVACELSFCYSNKILWNNARTWRNDRPWGDSKEIWANIVNDALYDWMLSVVSRHQETEERISLSCFVLSEQASLYDEKLKELFDRSDFVSALKNAVVRMIDLGPDMQTLINLIRAITIYNEGSYSLDVDFVPFLNHKIVEKRYDYNQAKEKMHSELRDSDYMAAYREVLGRVIRNWGM